MRVRSVSVLGCLIFVAGCGGSGGGGWESGKPLHRFPDRQSLAEIAASPEAAKPLPVEMFAPEEWSLAPVSAPQPGPARGLLAKLTPSATPDTALDCVAHELARVMLEQGKPPSTSLRRFISARCGALTSMPAFQSWEFEVPESEGEAAIYERLRAQQGVVDGAVTQAGAGLARSGKQGVIVVAYGAPEVTVDPFDRVVGEDGMLEIRGRVLFETDSLEPYINAGEYGVVKCELDPAIAAPAFAFRCPLAAGDDYAWVELFAAPKGRVLAHPVIGVLALRSETAATVYRARRLGEARPVQGAAAFERAVLELLNRIRGQAGMSPLVAASKQSQLASSVAPAFFGAFLSEDESAQSLVDAVSLGLLAGWDVSGGTIRTGDLVASLIVEAHDAERWLADALERPLGRVVLLKDDARVLAIGSTLQAQPRALGAVALTYAFFEEEDEFGERAKQVLERLAQVRHARKLGRTLFVADAPGVREQLGLIQRGETSPSDALQELMQQMANALPGKAVFGFVWETQSLDAIEFPKELLEKGDLTFGAGVTYYRAKGGAWGQYTVLFVVVKSAIVEA